MSDIVLYDYWRSSAAYRVRIALNALGIGYERVEIDLLAGDHKRNDHLARNPQGLVPALELDGIMLTQSLAIIEYLDETRAEANFLPGDARGRARLRQLAYAIAMEIHPVCNASVAAHVMELTGGGEQTRQDWMRRFIGSGLAAFETMLDDPLTGTFCHGDTPTMADFCLIPQLYNADRWGVSMATFPKCAEIGRQCSLLPAFAAAHPDAVKPQKTLDS
jgi:maleylacetoacetate isomerase